MGFEMGVHPRRGTAGGEAQCARAQRPPGGARGRGGALGGPQAAGAHDAVRAASGNNRGAGSRFLLATQISKTWDDPFLFDVGFVKFSAQFAQTGVK